MLCLMTLADVEAVSPETLTPWKEELLWRLYVDTYNHLTQRYGDEVIEPQSGGLDRAASTQRPDGLSPTGDRRDSSRGCRSATCSSSRATPSTGTCGWRATRPGRVHAVLERSATRCWDADRASRSTSRSCSRISPACCRRSAWTSCAASRSPSPNGLVARRVPFHRRRAVPGAEPRRRRTQVAARARGRRRRAARTSRRGCSGREAGRAAAGGCRGFAPVVHCDNESSSRYTILDIVAENALGLAVPHQPRDVASTAATSTSC